MSYEIYADYDQVHMFPPCVEDWVSEEHPARFIRDFVESLDLAELGFHIRKTNTGHPNYSSDLLLKIWVYGYYHKIRSTRGMEEACMDRMGLIWLTGRIVPDHNTLWRFWRDNKKAINKVFRKSTQVAQKAGLLEMVLHAVDGTKITSACSKEKAIHKEDLEVLIERIDESISEMMREVEVREPEGGEYRLPEELRDAKERRRVIKQSLEELDEKGIKREQPEDTESRMMQSDGKRKWSYNAQAVADEGSGIIVAESVTNEETDYHQLVPMLEEVKNNLEEVAQETVADGGYLNGEQLAAAEERGYEVIVNSDNKKSEGAYDRSKFIYDCERDCCICPEGEELLYSHKKKNGVKVYRCKTFKGCKVRLKCSDARGGRLVEVRPYHEAVDRNREKRRCPEKEKLLNKRKTIIEPVFGWIKENMGFRRWSVRGLENVRAQWSMICLTVNLKKMYKHWRVGRLVLS